VSCLAEQAKILFAEAEEKNLSGKALVERWNRWETCGLCKQEHHGVVRGALAWACWETYVGRPETDWAGRSAMTVLGNGLSVAQHHEDALPVREAELSILRRLGAPEDDFLVAQSNLSITYERLGRLKEALRVRQDVYSGRLRLGGEEHEETIRAANNYALSLNDLKRHGEAKSLLRKTVPVARRVLGQNHELVLRMRLCCAYVLYDDTDATLDDLREAVNELEETTRTARQVLGDAHPLTVQIEDTLEKSLASLAREGGWG
jgi:tetratricopeptide (TPR) repeat protein